LIFITSTNKSEIFPIDVFSSDKFATDAFIIETFAREAFISIIVTLSENNDEKLLILNCAKVEYKKRRGRPRKSKEKNANNIKIEEGQNLDVDI
jgi:hypothetical protein